MKRKIIKIDENLCNGCGLCAEACHEGAIGMANGKARLLRDDYCDGLGNCLPVCPTGAISFEEREAAAFDEAAVKANMSKQQESATLPCGCPGTHAHAIKRQETACTDAHEAHDTHEAPRGGNPSRLNQWPVQIKLVPANAPYLNGADLLVAADCTAFANGDFHERFIKGRITLIGCPKLDEGDYSEKLTQILQQNEIKSVTVVRMEVPCCAGIVSAVKAALQRSGRFIPWRVVTIATDGEVLEDSANI